jgi:hypothetical protein
MLARYISSKISAVSSTARRSPSDCFQVSRKSRSWRSVLIALSFSIKARMPSVMVFSFAG